MKRIVCGGILGVLGVLFFATATPHASAASLYMDPSLTHAYRADSVAVSVRLDTEDGECINTVDAVIKYDPNIIAVDVSRGDSILSLWVEDPKIDPVAHTVTFAGGVPNGYCGRVVGDPRLSNVIAKIIFQVPGFSVGGGTSTDANITFEPATRVLLNDGLGTNAPLKTFGSQITLDDKAGNTIADPWSDAVGSDKTLPSPFSIELVQDNNVFGGKYYIVFSTTDKQSGIDHYEVLEEPIRELSLFKWGAPNHQWKTVKNPYVLVDQRLQSVIRVKAIDKAGNERIATYAPTDTARMIDPYSALVAGAGVAVLFLIAGLVLYFLRRKFRKKETDDVTTEDHD